MNALLLRIRGVNVSLSSTPSDHRLSYQALGKLRVIRGGVDITPQPPKLAKLLALLIVRAGKFVPVDKLVMEVWGQNPPRCAVASLHVHVSQLRKILHHTGERSPIITSSPGYTLDIADAELDVRSFERLYEAGKALHLAGDFTGASEHLAEALRVWRGPVLDGVPGSVELDSFAAVLEERRLNCVELRIESGLALGRHRQVVEELKGLVVQHRLHEPFYRQLMIALYWAGRQGDALSVYRSARRMIREELGVEPGPLLRGAQEAILREDVAQLDVRGSASVPR